MQTAIRDSVNPFRPQDTVPPVKQTWRLNEYWLDMRPRSPRLPFSHGMWTSSLTGINNFVLAYPGLFFHFQVFVEEEGVEGYFVAFGALRFEPDPPSRRPHGCYQDICNSGDLSGGR